MLNKLQNLAMFSALMHAVQEDTSAGGAANVASVNPGSADVPKHINPELIKVDVNPTAQDIEAQVQTSMVEMKEVRFGFRKMDVLDPNGDKTDKEGNKYREFKRPELKVNIPLITKAGLVGALESGDKSTELIIDAVNDMIIARARGMLQDKIDLDPNVTLKPEDIKIEQLSLAAIASLPKSARGAGIPKEDFQAFVADYKTVMASAEAIQLFADKKPRPADTLEKHAILLMGKFNQIKSRQDLAQQMKGFLDIWVQVSPNAEEHLKVYEFLKAKAEAIIQGESFEDL